MRIKLEMCMNFAYSCISVTDKVKINEQNTSLATGPLYLRFLWFDNITNELPELRVLRFTRVTFGKPVPIECHHQAPHGEV